MYIIAAWTVKEKKDRRKWKRRAKQEKAGKKGAQENWEMGKEIEKWEGLENEILHFFTV
jgi:hypothetical protein